MNRSEPANQDILQPRAGHCPCGGGCPRCAASAHGAAGSIGSGQPLDAATRGFFEGRFGADLGAVRIHAGPDAGRSAAAMGAQAYTLGSDVAFAAGRFDPHGSTGRELLAHELAHVVQQTHAGISAPAAAADALEVQADRAAAAVLRGAMPPPRLNAAMHGVQRRVEMRDVGRGEFSGFDRLPQLIERLDEVSPSLLFTVVDGVLTYTEVETLTPNEFDRQMIDFIDSAQVIPLRLTDRHGLLGDRVSGFHDRVVEDAWSSGYVDIDDLLASSDLGLQSVLVHFLRERQSTPNYARRLGSPSMDFAQPGVQAEFDRVHARGIEAEVLLLRDFLGDPSIRVVPGAESGNIARVYRNDRRDRIRTRITSGRTAATQGVDAVSIEVRLHENGSVISIEEYRDLLERERREREEADISAQVQRERLAGVTEHMEGGHRVPAP